MAEDRIEKLLEQLVVGQARIEKRLNELNADIDSLVAAERARGEIVAVLETRRAAAKKPGRVRKAG